MTKQTKKTEITPIIFTDLDDTLFQTARKMTMHPRMNDIPASYAKNSKHSWMTPVQSRLFTWLNETTRLIPVTARSTETLSRCTLPFRDFKIASNGAVILDPKGHPDPNWKERIREISYQFTAFLTMLDEFVQNQNAKNKFRHWIVREQGLDIYCCIKSNGPEAWLDDLQDGLARIIDSRFLMHRNGNNLAVIPHDITKRAAVKYLSARISIPGIPVLGIGDSLSDLPFMDACDMMIIPTGSQIHETLADRQEELAGKN